MFDIGFAELLLIGVVGLLVIGPERLPGAIRTTSAWVSRIRRGFDDVKAEVQRELHNDEIMRQLRESADAVKHEIDDARTSVDTETDKIKESVQKDLTEKASDLNQ
ncbi:MAG: Sec-independent protein translocase protein TatB [Halieaceae bacterium]|jgi:sec-independent protein translocase protein TatB|nr:Sec-independent protein translocase protein TatB [Halieaceae bacterium]